VRQRFRTAPDPLANGVHCRWPRVHPRRAQVYTDPDNAIDICADSYGSNLPGSTDSRAGPGEHTRPVRAPSTSHFARNNPTETDTRCS